MDWNQVLGFLKEYGSFILQGVSIIIVIIVGIVKKRVKVGELPWTDLLLQLPGMINDAESTHLKGDGKLQEVVATALNFLSEYYGDAVFGDKVLIKKIIAAIEDILSTPTKK